MTDQRVDASTSERMRSGEVINRALDLTKAIGELVLTRTADCQADDAEQIANMALSAAYAYEVRRELERALAVLKATSHSHAGLLKVNENLIFQSIKSGAWEQSIKVALDLENLR